MRHYVWCILVPARTITVNEFVRKLAKNEANHEGLGHEYDLNNTAKREIDHHTGKTCSCKKNVID